MLTKPTQHSPSPVLPQGQPAQGGPRRKTRTEILVRVNQNGSYALPLNANSAAGFVVRNPSPRLVCLAALTYGPDASDDILLPQSGVGAWLVTMDAWIRLSREHGGRLTRGNNIVTNQPLPWAINEPFQALDELRGVVTVPITNNGGTNTAPGNLYLTATWEPAPGESRIPDVELQQMLGLADIVVQGGIAPSVGGA